MKYITKRLLAALLLVCMLSSMVVPATFAEDPIQPETLEYDFQLYKDAAFQADATGRAVDGDTGRIKANFEAHRTYRAGSAETIESWFPTNYPDKIDWGIETSNGGNGYARRLYL